MDAKKFRRTLRGANTLFAKAIMAAKEDETLVMDKESQRHCFDVLQHVMMFKTFMENNDETDKQSRIII